MLTSRLSAILKSRENENADSQPVSESCKQKTGEANIQSINVFSRRFEKKQDEQKSGFGGVLGLICRETCFAS